MPEGWIGNSFSPMKFPAEQLPGLGSGKGKSTPSQIHPVERRARHEANDLVYRHAGVAFRELEVAGLVDLFRQRLKWLQVADFILPFVKKPRRS